MVCEAASLSRRTVTLPSPTVSSDANVTAGSPSRSASIVGTTPMVPSVEAIPVMTRSGWGSSLPIAAARIAEVREGVRAVDLVVDDVDRPVGAHLQRLLQRVGGLLGADGQHGHLALARPR